MLLGEMPYPRPFQMLYVILGSEAYYIACTVYDRLDVVSTLLECRLIPDHRGRYMMNLLGIIPFAGLNRLEILMIYLLA